VAPAKFEEAFYSFPKGLKSEAERFISRYITTRIVEAHLTDAHKFASEIRKLATTISHSLVSVGCFEDDLSFSLQKVVSPESLIFSAAGLPTRASTKIKSFLRGQYDDIQDPLVNSPSSASTLDDTDIDFTIRGTRSSREIVGIYTVGEATVSAKISFPASYPLKKVSVSLVQRMGLTDNQSIPLEMQLTKLISNHGSSMTDVFSMMKQTVDSILRGIEPCPVCGDGAAQAPISIEQARALVERVTQAEAALKLLAQRARHSPDEDYRAYQQRLIRFNCGFVAQVHNLTTPKQRAAAAKRFSGWEEDVRVLAAQAK
jgi:hypothetical protein